MPFLLFIISMLSSMKYLKIYTAKDSTEAYLLKGLLEESSIEVLIKGEHLSIAIGELPLEVLNLEIWINSINIMDSKLILDQFIMDSNTEIYSDEWNCKTCSENNPSSFIICWNCQEVLNENKLKLDL